MHNQLHLPPFTSIYDLSIELPTQEAMPLSQWKGKYILIVNTASACGYTPQYADLDRLEKEYGDKIQVIGFPSNNFGAQEPGDDQQIAEFCETHFAIGFPLAKKSQVKKGEGQNPLYAWLTDSQKNGWLDQEPDWNFSKYLVGKDGQLLHYFGAAISPLDPRLLDYLI